MERNVLAKRISSNLHDKMPEKVLVEKRDPLDFLTPNRLDIIFKYLYAKEFLSQFKPRKWILDLYFNHIFHMNRFFEDDSSGKKGKKGFIKAFNELILSIKEKGFDPDKSIIPVNEQGEIIDGAHRIAAAIACQKKVTVAYFPGTRHDFSPKYFLNEGMSNESIDFAVFEYSKLVPNMFIAMVFPKAVGKGDRIDSILRKNAHLFYYKEIKLTGYGPQNLIKAAYLGEDWIGTRKNEYRGAFEKSANCFGYKQLLRLWFFQTGTVESANSIKKSIRSLFKLGNHSVHINDSRAEANNLSKILLNNNSVHFLNTANPIEPKKFFHLINQFEKLLGERPALYSNYCIAGSAVMAAYGLRDARDIDVLHNDKISSTMFDLVNEIDSHNSEMKYYSRPIQDIIDNPRNHFYLNGHKFASLQIMREQKYSRGETKDNIDIKLIDKIIGWNNFQTSRRNFKRQWSLFFAKGLRQGKKLASIIAPNWLITFYKKMRQKNDIGFQDFIFKAMAPLHNENTYYINYKGFKLFCNYGNSLIQQINDSHTYEEKLSSTIINTLSKMENPLFLDVGANIGLITLNVLAELQNAKIYAIEPGLVPAKLFTKTINENRLNNVVSLFPEALDVERGQKPFAVHHPRHSSGDGFFDTERAGKTTSITVKTTTLDNWWLAEGKPLIHAVKLDTEGSELWILRGGIDFLRACKPVIFLEIHHKNLIPYPYQATDIISFLTKLEYTVGTLNGDVVDSSNIDKLTKTNSDFIAFTNKDAVWG